jgi:subtilisin family serine protease
VRVLDCDGSGTVSGVALGLDRIVEHAQQQNRRPGVISLSLATDGYNDVLNSAVVDCLDAGFFLAAAAGNQALDACNTYPAATAGVVSVACSDQQDDYCYFSDYGQCVDVIAPGYEVRSAYIGSPTATATLSGTSMSTPHVAGFAAQVLGSSLSATRATVVAQLLQWATPGAISQVPNPNSTPNRLLYLPGAFNFTAQSSSTTSATSSATSAAATTVDHQVQSGAPRAVPSLLAASALLLLSLLLR